MMNRIKLPLLVALLLVLGDNAQSQTRKRWTTPVMVTEMNGGKIFVSYCKNSTDSIRYRISSKCQGLKNIYTCFAFKYLDRNNVERTQVVRNIPLAENFDKEYSTYAAYGIRKIILPYLPESIVAYVNDDSYEIDIREN